MTKVSLVIASICLGMAANARADIYRWDTGQVIPGTEGIVPGPGAQLDHRELEYALLREQDLSNANFASSDLSYANLFDAHLAGVSFDNALIRGVTFGRGRGFTMEQLYSTASYKTKDLRGLWIYPTDNGSADISGWDFSHHDLSDSYFSGTLLEGTDFTGAIVNGVSLGFTTDRGFTKEQLYSTASYLAHDLRRINLSVNDLSEWDFSGQDLSHADLSGANLRATKFDNALLDGITIVDIGHTNTGSYFTQEQLYSSSSYLSGHLRAVKLRGVLAGWNLNNQDLTDALLDGFLESIQLANSNLSFASIRGDLVGANLKSAQLFNTDLRRSNFSGVDLTDATMFGVDLRESVGFVGDPSGTARNIISSDGEIASLDVRRGETLILRPSLLCFMCTSPRITVADSFSLQRDATLVMQLSYPFKSDRLSVDAIQFRAGTSVDVEGLLQISSPRNVRPSDVGVTLDLFDWPESLDPSDRFARIDVPAGTQWDLSRLYTTGEVVLLSVPEPSSMLLVVCGIVAVVLPRVRKARVTCIAWLLATSNLTAAEFDLSLVYPGGGSSFQVAGENLFFTSDGLLRYDGFNIEKVVGGFSERKVFPEFNATLGSELYFVGDVGVQERASLFRTDGTNAVDVGLAPYAVGGAWAGLYADRESVLFVGEGNSDLNGTLYRVTGDSYVNLGVPLKPGKFRAAGFASVGQTVYVSDGTHLWAVNDLDTVQVPSEGIVSLGALTPMRDFLLLTAKDELGTGLFYTDGTDIRRISDTFPGNENWLRDIHVLGDDAFFVADFSTDPNYADPKLLKSNGTSTVVLPSFRPTNNAFGTVNGKLIIRGQLDGGPEGIYATDGESYSFLGETDLIHGGEWMAWKWQSKKRPAWQPKREFWQPKKRPHEPKLFAC